MLNVRKEHIHQTPPVGFIITALRLVQEDQMRDETIRKKFIRWTEERTQFALSSFFAEADDPRGHQHILNEILPLLSECGCEMVKREGDLIIRWKEQSPCIPADIPEIRKVESPIQTAIESFITAKTGKPWSDPATLERIREAVVAQKDTYWKEGDERIIRYTSGYSIFAYLAYHFPVYYIQMRHLIRELMNDGLLPQRMAVLDVGSGPGTVTLALASLLNDIPGCRATVHSIEQAGEFIEAYRQIAVPFAEKGRRVTALPPLATDITDPKSPLHEGPYDLIVCANVLNEIHDITIREETVMRLASRLRENGTLLICEPADLANATTLRDLSRRLKKRGLSIYAPCNDIRGVPCMVERCWSFITLPEMAPTRLMNAVAAGDESFRFYNTDIKTAFAIHRKDGKKRVSYRVPPGTKAERISRLSRHEEKKINIIASKISENIGDSGTFLYRICDGTGKREAYAALPAYHITEENAILRQAAYGSVLRFNRVLVRHHKKYDAYHLLLTKESTVELIEGELPEGEPAPVREARRETKKAVKRRREESTKAKGKKTSRR
ncbi:methyltransferase domain-containing protein [Methanocalculus taiwanensis]|uniref:Methyltransferase domain-containing protein n=1 Tax=Methanocalculus taiwanensis TaxID=106207 RepID=A0ABD4TP87_9EURY|nr:methyltransferase domain-containing protein [Methanocalculus taiwanensis]MCQ1539579.1 methyltransferase domain-containing protein [Methanocalculus taiwanensis]